jgi:hypothetical protein
MSSNALHAIGTAYDDHQERSHAAQWRADKWMMAGSAFMGTAIFGLIGLPLFLRGLVLQVRAQQAALSVRPTIVTLIGYLVFIDAALNSFGWALDLVANHTLLAPCF